MKKCYTSSNYGGATCAAAFDKSSIIGATSIARLFRREGGRERRRRRGSGTLSRFNSMHKELIAPFAHALNGANLKHHLGTLAGPEAEKMETAGSIRREGGLAVWDWLTELAAVFSIQSPLDGRRTD